MISGKWVSDNAELIRNVDVVVELIGSLKSTGVPSQVPIVFVLGDLLFPHSGYSFHRFSKADYTEPFSHT